MTSQSKQETDRKIDELYEKTRGNELNSAQIANYCGVSVSTITGITRRALVKLEPQMKYLFE